MAVTKKERGTHTFQPLSASDLPLSVTVDALPELLITNAIESTAFDLNAGVYSVSSALTNDYILDHIQFNFSSTESRTITVTASDGTILWTAAADTSLDIVLEDIEKGYNSGDDFTIDITQTAGACTVDVLATVREGSVSLSGNPTVKVEGATGDDVTTTTIDSKVALDVNLAGGSIELSDATGAEGVVDLAIGEKALRTQNDPKQYITSVTLLQDLVLQMKKMNKHLESITGEKFLDEEIEES
jgi:hypothetical protein